MDKTFVHVIMIATSLTIFFAIIYLLNILKKVPYKPV